MITIPDPADKMPDNYKPLSDAELDAMVGSYDPDKLNQLLDDVRYHRQRCADLERRLAFATAALKYLALDDGWDEVAHRCDYCETQEQFEHTPNCPPIYARTVLTKLREPEATAKEAE